MKFDRVDLVRCHVAMLTYYERHENTALSLLDWDAHAERVHALRKQLGIKRSECNVRAVAEYNREVFLELIRGNFRSGYCGCACRDCLEPPIVGFAGITFCDDCESAGCMYDAECQVVRCDDCHCAECECHWLSDCGDCGETEADAS